MKVFLSWSGPRSKAIAESLRKWLPKVLQAVKPYFSPDDVAKGTRWSTEIAEELDASKVGVLILTPENLGAPWLLFEAGALGKSLGKSKVCPLLFGVKPTDVTGPLAQFQAASFDQDEMFRVVKAVNTELDDGGLEPDVLQGVFEKWWPDLQSEIERHMDQPHGEEPPQRSDREILEEILTLVRALKSKDRGFSLGIANDNRGPLGDVALDALLRDPSPHTLDRLAHAYRTGFKDFVLKRRDDPDPDDEPPT